MTFQIAHKTKGTHNCIVDEEDYERVNQYNWTLNYTSNPNTFYAKSIIYKVVDVLPPSEARPNTTKKVFTYDKTLHLHRLIMGLGDYREDKRIVNHINGNGLDNRKCNLEVCDIMYNSQSINCPNRNVGHIDYDTSMKRQKRWRFQITQNGKRHSKRFKTEQEAINYRETFVEPQGRDAKL